MLDFEKLKLTCDVGNANFKFDVPCDLGIRQGHGCVRTRRLTVIMSVQNNHLQLVCRNCIRMTPQLIDQLLLNFGNFPYIVLQ